MTCEDFRSRLTAFSLGELEAGEAEAAREHVGHCSACASAVLLDRQLTALLRSSAVPAPRALRNQGRAALRAQAAQRRDGRQRPGPAVVAEYRSDSGRRVALIRWRGQLPRTIGAAAETGQDVETVSWGGTGSAWWRSDDGVVWCLIGSADRQTLERLAERLYGES